MAEDLDKETIEAFAKLHNMGMKVTGGKYADAVILATDDLNQSQDKETK